MNKYEVGFDDEFIGVYYSDTKEDAIFQCRKDMQKAGIWTTIHSRNSIGQNWIVNKVNY